MTDEKILSICIPTYNRSNYLEVSLSKLFDENKIDTSSFEVLIGDNSDNFNSSKIVKKFINLYNNIFYTKHLTNIGAEANYQFLLEKSKGHFFLILGDDDYISNKNLTLLIEVLKKNQDAGIINLNRTYIEKNYSNDKKHDINIANKKVFFQNVNLWITHISSNVINKKYLSTDQIFDIPQNTQFPHIYWMGCISKLTDKYIIVNNKVIYCTPRNSFGYDIFDTFSNDLFSILQNSFDHDLHLILRKKMHKKILINFFPQYLIENKKLMTYSNKKNKEIIKKIELFFNNCGYYYISILPFSFLPTSLYKIYNKILRIILR